MLGTRTAGELARSALGLEAARVGETALRTLLEAAGSARATRAAGATGAAIKDGTSALDARAGCRSSGSGRWRWRRWGLVDGTWPRLRHDDLADGYSRDYGSRRGCGSFRRGLNCRSDRRCKHFGGRRLGRGRLSDGRWSNYGRSFDDGWGSDGRRDDGCGCLRLRSLHFRRSRGRNDDGRSRGCDDSWTRGDVRLGDDGLDRGGRRSRRSGRHCRPRDDRSCASTCSNCGPGNDGRASRADDSCAGSWMHDGRSLTRLGHDHPWLLAMDDRGRRNDARSSHGRSNDGGCSRTSCRGSARDCRGQARTGNHSGRRGGSGGTMGILCESLGFLLFGQNGLHHIARLGDVGEVNFGLRPRVVPGAGCRRSRLGSPLKMPANSLRLKLLDGAGVGFAFRQIHVLKRFEDFFALDFQLARQIVNSNLTHPPLFVVLPTASVTWS